MTVGAVVAALALLALAFALAWVAAPLWRGAPAPTADDPRVVALLAEREAILAALRDLDADAADGRLAPDDHRALRVETVARGAAVLAALDAVAAGDRPPSPSAAHPADAVEADVRAWRARSAAPR